MTAPFDWAGLADWLVELARQADDATEAERQVGEALRTRIEAAFVPVEQRDKAEALLCQRTNEYIEATARAEAAEARNKVLEEALRYMANTSLIDDDYQAIAREALGGEHE